MNVIAHRRLGKCQRLCGGGVAALLEHAQQREQFDIDQHANPSSTVI